MHRKIDHRIVWTQTERKKLAFAVYYHIKLNPEISKLHAINLVQSTVLLSHRKRKIYSYNAVSSWLDEELELLYSSDVQLNAELELSKIPSETIINELFNRFENKVNANIKLALTDIEKNIENKIISRISELENVLIDLSSNKSDNTITPKLKKKKILIVGLLHNQFNEIKHEYSEYFDLKLWSLDSSIPKLKSMLTYSDHTLVMVNFINHSADGVIANAKNPYSRISGGMSSLKDELDKLI